MYTEESLNQRLAEIVQHRASGMGFSPGCEREVFRRVEYAAHRISSEGLLADQDNLKLAEANINLFISEMTAEANRRGYGSMHEDVLAATLENLCPLWPIC